MKTLCTLTLTALFGLTLVSGAEGKHLFLLSGQSNMQLFSPKASFIPAVVKEFGENNVIIIKDAKGGRPIKQWYVAGKGNTGTVGPLYKSLIQKAKEATEGQKIKTITFIWMQGESDTKKAEVANAYAENLKGLIAQLKTDLGRKDINVVIGRISDHDNKERFPYWDTVRKVQVEVADSDPSYAWIDTDDLNDGLNGRKKEVKNDLHYTPSGYKTLGKRFAEEAIKLIKK